MPRYAFHTQFPDGTATAPETVDLPDPDAAWEAARATIRASLSAAPEPARLMAACLVVTDAEGAVVLEFPFGEAALPPPDPGRH